ncbi:MAG: nucleotide sugar dehydrogenase [Candidatus Buchananbacteria bacterium]|nr:nucleotide sugar dehydrogenase [Candidatus Buchananbacteria bacterium]
MIKEKICVVGLGYVGLPLACLLSKHFEVSGFDINEKKIKDLENGFDETGEVDDLKKYQINYSSDPAVIGEATFIIVAVPTPITETNEPDLSPVESASKIVGQHLKPGAVVVYESTVYPGCTEEICLPILEQESGLKLGRDFEIGYSPERINPGDKVHTVDKIEKIISASTPEALERLKKVYGLITKVFEASSIKVAEAAKVIENVQRSLNIALMNELALIFDKLGISTKDVLAAAGTKWNFHKYQPGLVGGHCIGVDPYYLTHKAQQVGYDPKIILSGQEVNESMAGLVADKFAGKKNVLIMGITFKENVPDSRNTKALNVIKRLTAQGIKVFWHDPVFTAKHKPEVFSTLPYLKSFDEITEKFDGILIFSPHAVFAEPKYALTNLRNICKDNSVIFDVKGFYDKTSAQNLGFTYLTL